ncbi:MAG: hypothetical protein ACKOU7_07115 [Ferruginibacter sp.]
MRVLAFFLLLSLGYNKLAAQKDSAEKIIAFIITDYIMPLGDSSSAVQVYKPASFPVPIREKQLGVLYHSYKNGIKPDTAMIGWGRCNLIKGDYYYFGIHLQKDQQATEGDLVYLKLKVPYVYDGLLLNVMNHAIEFTNVYGQSFLNRNDIFTNSKKDELNILDSMVRDIQFTGGAMLQQMPEQNQLVTDGMYKGKKIFESMQAVKRSELELFLKYVAARPKNYAGNTWKISETFATWMAGGTPTIIEN